MSNRGCFRSKKKRAAKRKMILEVGHCVQCGTTNELTIDHIVPRKFGGANAKSNWQVLCRACNLKKSTN